MSYDTENDVTPSEHLVRRVDALNLPFNDGIWFLGGSSALALRDIRRVSDIDVGVTTEFWAYLQREREYDMWTPDDGDETSRCDPPYLRTSVMGTEVHFFFGWRRRTADETRFNDFNLVFREGTEEIKGVPVIKLPILLRQKVDALWTHTPVRAKDLRDIEVIVKHIGAETVTS